VSGVAAGRGPGQGGHDPAGADDDAGPVAAGGGAGLPQGAGDVVEVVVGDGVDHEREHVLIAAGVPACAEGAVVVGGKVQGGGDLAVGELLGEHLAQVGLVRRRRGVA